MTKMIKRVARALCKADGTDPDWEGPDPEYARPAWMGYVDEARISVAAMRHVDADDHGILRAVSVAEHVEPTSLRRGWDRIIEFALADD